MKDSATPNISDYEIASKLWECIDSKVVGEPREARTIIHSKHRYPKHLTALKPSESQRHPFIVADTETVLINDVHIPYAVGFLVVRPGDDLSSETGIDTYFSEDYPGVVIETFEERSEKMLFDFIECLAVVVRKNPWIQTVYFHNFSRFDGIILLKYLATHGVKYTFIPLMRNHRLYELAVYSGKKILFRFRDSLNLLPGKLSTLAKNLCRGLGQKGSIPYDEVTLSNLASMKKLVRLYEAGHPSPWGCNAKSSRDLLDSVQSGYRD